MLLSITFWGTMWPLPLSHHNVEVLWIFTLFWVKFRQCKIINFKIITVFEVTTSSHVLLPVCNNGLLMFLNMLKIYPLYYYNMNNNGYFWTHCVIPTMFHIFIFKKGGYGVLAQQSRLEPLYIGWDIAYIENCPFWHWHDGNQCKCHSHESRLCV